MIERIREALARRAAFAAVAARRPRVLATRPEARTLLVVLPTDEPGQRAAWSLIVRLDLPDSQVIPVVVGGPVAYAPDRFAGHVEVVGADEYDWRRLPRRAVAERLWARSPDVALNLADTGDLAAAVLVGASPAAVRIGRHDAEVETFYDLMISGDDGDPAGAVGRLLVQLDPPVLPLASRADPA